MPILRSSSVVLRTASLWEAPLTGKNHQITYPHDWYCAPVALLLPRGSLPGLPGIPSSPRCLPSVWRPMDPFMMMSGRR
eukprot:2825576-Pyramimonas_sp.AAC.1